MTGSGAGHTREFGDPFQVGRTDCEPNSTRVESEPNPVGALETRLRTYPTTKDKSYVAEHLPRSLPRLMAREQVTHTGPGASFNSRSCLITCCRFPRVDSELSSVTSRPVG